MLKNKYVIIGAVVFLVAIIALTSCQGKAKTTTTTPTKTSTNLSDEEYEAQRLKQKFGEPPQGFKWSDSGDLIAIGDKTLTSEEVAYNYLKGASTLDFDLLQKSSNKSKVVSTYEGYYDNADYKAAFQRKMYKQVLKSMIVDKIEDTALFADTKCIYTFSIDALDLTNKDFWKADKTEIYKNLYTYYRDEDDTTKAKQYIYDYILKWYASDKSPKKQVQIEVTLSKGKSGAWLVTGDDDLDSLCKYADGETVNDYIYNCYKDWYDDSYNK